jgi:hypothetical protein
MKVNDMAGNLNLEWLKKLKPELFVNLAHAFISIAIILICCIVLMKLVNRLLRKLTEKKFISLPSRDVTRIHGTRHAIMCPITCCFKKLSVPKAGTRRSTWINRSLSATRC